MCIICNNKCSLDIFFYSLIVTLYVNQHSETNMIHFLFNLLRIKGLNMFRALLAHLQEALHQRHLLYCVRVMSVGCTRIGVHPTDITRTNITSAVGVAPPEDEQVMLKTCRDP
jgi:hypothetical protein